MDSYTQSDKTLHILGQYLARINKSYLPPVEDDSHTNLGFDRIGNRLSGRWINSGGGSLLFSFNLNSCSFEWLDGSLDAITAIPVPGRDYTELWDDIRESTASTGLNPDKLIDVMHYTIPNYYPDSLSVPEFGTASLEQWIFYRGLANEACNMVFEHLNTTGEIRIWPHHFDTGVFVPAATGIGIGFGLAMEDDMAGAPYFYLAGYPAKGKLSYLNLPEIDFGQWITASGWKGAVLPIDKIRNLKESDQQDAVSRYIAKGLQWFLSQKVR